MAGRLSVNGKPAPAAVVALHPVSGLDVRPDDGRVGADGTFPLTSATGSDGAPDRSLVGTRLAAFQCPCDPFVAVYGLAPQLVASGSS